MNLIDYVDWRGDLTFAERGFNEVDNVIFSTLTYFEADGIIGDGEITVRRLYELGAEKGLTHCGLANDPMPMLERMARSERFKDVVISDFVNNINVDRAFQFSAMTLHYAEGEAYIAFRGTDDTIVGWREDMNMSFLSATPGQFLSAEYINRIAQKYSGSFIVGGHSKGGNFAVYGAAFCEQAAKDRIKKVYTNDGPGFNKSIAESEEYKSIIDRTEKIIPESTLVGILLSSRVRRKIIKSSAKGVLQHDPLNWNVLGDSFEEAGERSVYSLFLDETLNNWVSTLDDDSLRMLTDTVFEVLEATGASTISQLSRRKRERLNSALIAISNVSPDSRRAVMEMLKKLMLSGADTMRTDTSRNIERLIVDVSKASNKQH